MYKGELEGFPKEVVDKMLERQFEQTCKKDVSVFEIDKQAEKSSGGMDWCETEEGEDWWHEVIIYKNFPKFYERYPKQNIMDKKTLVQQLIAQDPSKEAELRKIYPDVLGHDLVPFVRKQIGSDWMVFGNDPKQSPCIDIYIHEGDQCFFLDKNHVWEIRDGHYLHVKPKP